MNKQPQSVAIEPDISDRRVYGELAVLAFELLERFALDLMPIIWRKEKTTKQAQIFALVLSRQMLGNGVSVSEIAREFDYPRSSVQNAVDYLIDRGRLDAKIDPNDGRRKLLTLPIEMAQEVGAIEELLLRYLVDCHEKTRVIIDQLETRKEQTDLKNLKKAMQRLLDESP